MSTISAHFPQYTEEKLGQAEKTELDAHFENLVARAEKTRIWTEKILAQTEAVLQPNPGKTACKLHDVTSPIAARKCMTFSE